jgi:hypothetical protein
MSALLRPWLKGPFELLLHAELHFREAKDFDRRMALISYDNAIEIAIASYLSLNPIHRGNRTYEKKQVFEWLKDYHTKLDFFLLEVQARCIVQLCEKEEFVWYHDIRNEQYHGGKSTIPQLDQLEGIRRAAIWVFCVLFDEPNIETYLDLEVRKRLTPERPQRNNDYDRLIDETYGTCLVAGDEYRSSHALYALNPDLYFEMGATLEADEQAAESTEVA